MEFLVLGPIEVHSAGQPLPVGGIKQRSILALLIANQGRAVSTDRIAHDIYGDDAAGRARRSIQSIVSVLRHDLGDVITSTGDGYLFDALVGDTVDASRFNDAVGAGLGLVDAQPEQASAVLSEALELWRGDPYADVDGQAVFEPEIIRLNELRHTALEARIEADLGSGRHRLVISELEALVAEFPLREQLWGLLMLALYRTGRQGDALRTYQQLRGILGEELGIEPTIELRDLENQILLQDPALNLAPVVPHNLPAQLTSFIGRELEMMELANTLTDTPLITLTGAGGSGKTRLAIELARHVQDDYPDGVWFIDLRTITDPSDLPAVVATTLQAIVTSDLPITDQLAEALWSRRILLILDNCEHVLNTAAPFIEQLLQHEGTLRILATSRQPLGIPGEPRVDVRPLPVPEWPGLEELETREAAILFTDRAHRVMPTFVLNDHTESVFAICRAVDGLPLALELASARLRTYSPEELNDQLTDQLAVLKTKQRTGDLRHATIEATIQWSWNLLDNSERTLLSRLSVFPGSWTLAACESICSVEPTDRNGVRSLVVDLVDKSLIILDGTARGATRYRLLEPIRQFAAHHIDEMNGLEVRDRLVSHWSKTLAKPPDLPWITLWDHKEAQTLEPDQANLSAAVDWAIATNRFEDATTILASPFGDLLMLAGAFGQMSDWIDMLISHQDQIDSGALLSALQSAGSVASGAFRNKEWSEYANLGIEMSRTPLERQWFEIGRAVATNRLGYHDKAFDLFDDLIANGVSPGIRASALIGRAQYEYPDQAWETLQQALALCPIDSLGWWDDGVAALMIADAAYDAGRYRDAIAFGHQSLDFAVENGWLVVEGHAAGLLAITYAALGRFDEATAIVNEAAQNVRRILGPNIATSLVLRRAAGVNRVVGNYDMARRYAERARREAVRYGIKNWEIFANLHIALIARDEGDLEAANEALRDAITEMDSESVLPVLRGHTVRFLTMYQATVALRMGEPDRALFLLEDLLYEYRVSVHEDIVMVVDLSAIALAREKMFDIAAHLFGAIDAEREQTGLFIAPPDLPIRDQAIQYTRDHYDGDWDAAVDRGRKSTLNEAAELAGSTVKTWLASRNGPVPTGETDPIAVARSTQD